MRRYLFILLLGCGVGLSCQTPKKVSNTVLLPSTPLQMESNVLKETRKWNLWSPDSTAKTDSLPLLILLDGGLEEDFAHVVWTIDSLIKDGAIQPIRLAGIENTQRRRDFTGPTQVEKDKEIAPIVGKSADFRQYLKEEAIPALYEQFPNTTSLGIIGESLAGLFIMETFLLEPTLFQQYIAFDPSLWWNEAKGIEASLQLPQKLDQPLRQLWYAGSNATDIFIHTRHLAQQLESLQMPSLKWKYADAPDTQHSTIFRTKKAEALKWMYGNE